MNGSYSEFDLDIKNSHQQHDLRLFTLFVYPSQIDPFLSKVRKICNFEGFAEYSEYLLKISEKKLDILDCPDYLDFLGFLNFLDFS